jgi:hypothetical protein
MLRWERNGNKLAMEEQRTGEDELHFDVKFVVRRIVSWPRYRKGMDDSTAGRIAREIVNHLRLTNWRFHKGPPTAGHSTPGPRREP